MDDAVRALLLDSRLSSDARVIGFYIASKGPGAHEIDRGELLDILSADAGKGRVQRALRQLAKHDWVHRTPGGRNHSDRYEFRGRESDPLNQIGAAKVGTYTDSGRNTEHLNTDPDDRGRETQHLNHAGSDRCRESEPLNDAEGGTIGGFSGKSPSSSVEAETDRLTTTTTPGAGEREESGESVIPFPGPRVSDTDDAAFVREAVTLANKGMQDNPAIRGAYNPIVATGGEPQETVLGWLRDKIPRDVIRRVVYDRAKEYTPTGRWRQITRMSYFDAAVRDAADREAAKTANTPKTSEGGRHGASGGERKRAVGGDKSRYTFRPRR